MISKTNLIRISVCLVYFCVITGQIVLLFSKYIGYGMDITSTRAMQLWWEIQFSGVSSSTILDVLQMIVFTTLLTYISIYIKNNQFFTLVHQRTGYSRFLQSTFLKSFCSAFFLSFITHIYGLVLFSILCKQIPSFVKIDDIYINTAFQDNTFISWFIFVLLSAIGWGIYAILICSIGLFINKNSVFFVSGAVIGTLLIVVPAMLVANDLLRYLFSIVILPSLIIPGQLHFFQNVGTPPNVWLIFGLSACLYTGVSVLLAQKWVHDTQSHG